MRLAADLIHLTPHGGRCRIRIYEGENAWPVVVCTELEDNSGMSITNACEFIAAEVIHTHQLYTPLQWIEHYEDGARGTPSDPSTFDIVEFAHYEVRDTLRGFAGTWRKEIGEPSWRPSSRSEVEGLIGDRVE
jgi:hypothetical protein